MNTRTVPFRPTPRRIPPLRDHIHTLESPLKADEKIKPPILMRLLPVAIVVLVVVMLILMVSMGRRMFSPMMLMMPAMLLMGMMGMTMHGGAGGNSMAEVDVDRKNWLIQIRELRHQVQNQGRRIHALAVANFPNPNTLTSLTAYRRMWQVRESNAYMEALADSKLTQFPFMTARAGVGMAPLEPAITFDPQEVPENLEPVTAGAFSRFLRTQQYVTNIPIGIRLNEERAYGLRGDEQGRLDLSRSFITSLAFNHTPSEVAIGIITDTSRQECVKEWDWVKWLPHNQDYDMAVASGMPPVRYAWRSLQEYADKMAYDIAARTTQGSEYEGPNMVIFVDLPDENVSWPVNIIGGVPGVVFVVVRFATDDINHYDDTRVNVIAVDERGMLSVPGRRNLLTIDRFPRRRAENFARSLARWRPAELGGGGATAASTEAGEGDLPSWFDVLGIPDIDSYDPRVVWRANAFTETFRVPMGYKYDGKNKTPEIQYMDLIEISRGGSGPHGCLQGKTGTGKSYLLNNIVLTMCAMYGPDKVSFILADFKAGAAFDGFEGLPHVVAVLTNLETQKEMVDRAGDVIDGEIARREEFLFQHKAKDILDYRKMQKNDPSLPPLPDLFVIADEFHEFMHNNRAYLKLFTRIGAKGRSLGMHIIPCSQFIDTTLLQDLMNHLTVGISLTASSASYSRAVLDGNPGAAQLPAGKGHAMIRYVDKETQENRVDTFVGFAIEDPYVSKVRTEEEKVSSRREMEDTAMPFGLFATSVEEHKKSKGDSAKKNVTETKTDKVQKWTLIEHLCKFQDVQSPQLWQESLMVPMSLANIKTADFMAMRNSGDLRFRLGDLDDPYRHARPPFVIAPDSNVAVYGGSKSGKSTAIMAMIASSALVYQGDVAWYIIDYAGGSLESVEKFPNVGGYATKADNDHIERYLGEMYNVLDYREQVMSTRRTPRFADYLAHNKANPDPRDPYGYMMLVIDGYDALVLEDETWKTSIMRLLLNGPRHGIRVVITAPDVMSVPIKQQGQFPAAVVLRVDDPSRMGSTIDSNIRQRIKTIPDQPGRGIDTRSGMPSLIFVPKFEEIVPLVAAERGRNAVYNYAEDHSAGVANLGAKLAERIPAVPRIATVPHKVPYADLWSAFSSAPGAVDADTPLRDRWLPLGVDTRTLVPVLVPKNSPHMLIAGGAQSGRTTAARTIITSVVNQYKPNEAKFVLIDPDYALMNEMEHLVRDGYMKPDNYASSREETRGPVEALKKLLTQRAPRKELGLTPRDIRERTWFKGPEMFVIVDGYNRVGSQPGTQGPIDELVPFLQSATDMGVHIILTTTAVGIGSQFSTNKMYKFFVEQSAPIMMLSGPANEPSITPMKVKFEDRRPGFGKFVLTGESKIVQTQIAYTEPWDSVS